MDEITENGELVIAVDVSRLPAYALALDGVAILLSVVEGFTCSSLKRQWKFQTVQQKRGHACIRAEIDSADTSLFSMDLHIDDDSVNFS